MTLTTEQKEGIKIANEALKKVFPHDNLQISFNLSKNHSNVNFNIKISGILEKHE
ncbi:hypothetical protein LCGC14_2174820 [marine sediment metagenome]|uniref:Uncharacterized protein n=1 Tax=marine sediment metagenome TaxID=412755 RepID=A0A0F9G1N9_9ZZZZ